jgi:hypothetical protein
MRREFLSAAAGWINANIVRSGRAIPGSLMSGRMT